MKHYEKRQKQIEEISKDIVRNFRKKFIELQEDENVDINDEITPSFNGCCVEVGGDIVRIYTVTSDVDHQLQFYGNMVEDPNDQAIDGEDVEFCETTFRAFPISEQIALEHYFLD